MTHAVDTGSQNCWNNVPYYEDGAILAPTGPLLDWPFHQTASGSASQSPTMQRDCPGSFLSGSFHDIPDITWDQMTPDTANPSTPPSPYYRSLQTGYGQQVESNFDPSENHQSSCAPKPFSRPYQPLTMSLQHRLRSQKIRNARQQSPKLDPILGEHLNFLPQAIPSPSNVRKPDFSPNLAFTAASSFNDDRGTPDSHLDEPDGDATPGSEPYAQLIYRALKSVPTHSMVLKEIYEWFEQNTDKPQTSTSSKGWQNSIRHNLSMNGAFTKVDQVPPSEDAKKGFIWVLAESALQEGVKSTTRYRKQNPNKKSCRTEHPAPQRQISGAKGGKAAKKSALYACKMNSQKPRRIPRTGKGLSSYSRATPATSPLLSTMAFENPLQVEPRYEQEPIQHYLHTPSATPISLISEPRSFSISDIVGCTDLGDAPLFYDEPVGTRENGIQFNEPTFTQSENDIGYEYPGVAI
ncbi:MAG: hypothetical protein Q9191_005220 [Dirinaria sp. TL-2023a]